MLLTPTIAHRPREVGVLDKGGTVRAALAAQPMIAYCALWNVTGNPAASVPAGIAADGLPLAVQLVGRHNDETTLLSLSAQIEAARPWTMPVLGPAAGGAPVNLLITPKAFVRRHVVAPVARLAGSPLPSPLAGRVVLVTGASSGVGEASARAIAERGATVLCVARRPGELDRVVAEIESAGGSAYGYVCDLTDPTATDALVEQVLREHGPWTCS